MYLDCYDQVLEVHRLQQTLVEVPSCKPTRFELRSLSTSFGNYTRAATCLFFKETERRSLLPESSNSPRTLKQQ